MDQNLARLIERTGDLKGELLRYARSPAMKKEFDAELRAYQAEVDPKFGGGETVEFLDDFIMLHHCRDGRSFLEHFVAAHPKLPDDEKEMILGWKNAVTSMFEIEKMDGDALIAVSLVDEMTYRIYSNAGPAALRQLMRGAFLYSRVAPVGDVWVISGHSEGYAAQSKQQVYAAAYELSMAFPDYVFRNPEKRERGFELQREDYRQFVAFFGTDTISIPVELFENQMREYMLYKLNEARGEDGRTVRERVEAQGGTVGPLPEIEAPEWNDPVESIGLLCDEREGVLYMPDYAMLEAAFEYPELVKEKAYGTLVKGYFQSPEIDPLALHRLAARDYERASEVVRLLFSRPKFSWERDAEEFLKPYKAKFANRDPNPGIIPISSKLTEAVRKAA